MLCFGLDCCNRILQTEWLTQQTFISGGWEFQDQGTSQFSYWRKLSGLRIAPSMFLNDRKTELIFVTPSLMGYRFWFTVLDGAGCKALLPGLPYFCELGY